MQHMTTIKAQNGTALQKGGAEKAFENLIREFEALLHKICRVYAPKESDRDDLFQEMVIQLWKSYPNFKGESKLSTWIYRVAINTAITSYRKQKDLIQSFEPERLPAQAFEQREYEQQEEQLDVLYRAIEQLNQIEKAIVMLYLEDRSYEEMEEILGINQGNLRVKMSRIKEKIRQITKKN
jgi:RNA polymerase sigma-70 factor (ECF subfamily)